MKVRVHPHYGKFKAGRTACISVTPWGRSGVQYFGAVLLGPGKFVIHQSGLRRAQREKKRNVHAWAVGDLLYSSYQRTLPEDNTHQKMTPVHYHYDVGRFKTDDGRDVTDNEFKAAYIIGKNIYIEE